MEAPLTKEEIDDQMEVIEGLLWKLTDEVSNLRAWIYHYLPEKLDEE